ncbi:nucleolar complex protein 2 isoform X3 [Anabrus simplex]|uniref:nucleolar complex protein 2 isoform X3 n=1 Tax=Anabrus simplex TaxID=316456 RepID=UPI0035A2AF42
MIIKERSFADNYETIRMKPQIKKKPLNRQNLKKKKKTSKTAVDLSTQSVDEFLDQDWSAVDSDDESNGNENAEQDTNNDHHVSEDDENGDVDDGDDDTGSFVLDAHSHKKSLQNLRDLDPEFYEYLSQNDKSLLEFSGSEDESGDKEESEEEEDGDVHKLPDKLEVGSDESDYEGEGATERSRVITLKMVNAWQENLQTDKSVQTIKCVVKAFHAALLRVSGDEDERDAAVYKVDGSSVFNAIIQLCVLELQPALKRFLKLPASGNIQPFKCKRWPKVKSIIKFYLKNLLKLLGGVTSTQIVAVLLKHLHQMTPFLACYTQMTRPLLKKLVHFWSGGEETVRVVAFLCLLKITTGQQKEILEKVLKETLQSVYNWQFVQSLHLWSDVLGATANKPQLEPLIYPVVQVVIGTIKLIPTAQYFPLRFHCIQILIQLSKSTGTFIPLLPFLLEVLNTYDFNKPHSKVSMKPIDFTFALRLSKTQLQENGFKDAVIDRIYQQLLEHLTNESYRIDFPDSVVFTKIQLKAFIKKCKVSNYCKKMRQVVDKIEENAQAVLKERSQVSFALNDQKAIDAWETNLKLKGTPLMKFYESWNKLHTQQQAKKITENEKLGDFNLPVLKKREKKVSVSKSEGPVELFPSDDSDEDNNMFGPEETEEPKKKRGKRGGKGKKQRESKSTKPALTVESEQADNDIIEDLHLSDLE